MQTGRMRPWVVLYAAFVSALLGKGLQLAFGMGQPWCFLVLVGAVKMSDRIVKEIMGL